jgi:hypothetical protein
MMPAAPPAAPAAFSAAYRSSQCAPQLIQQPALVPLHSCSADEKAWLAWSDAFSLASSSPLRRKISAVLYRFFCGR